MALRTYLGSMITAASFAASALTGCGGGDGAQSFEGSEGEEVGSLELLLSTVPSDAACLEVTLSGSRTVTKTFELAAGTTPRLSVDRLPVGAVKVDARAFADQCSKVKSTSVPNFVLEKAITAKIDALTVAKILLKLIRNGRSEITVDFEAPPWLSTATAPVDLAIIGDTPYGAKQIEDFPNLMAAIDADQRISTVVHVGDMKEGSGRCDDSYFAQIFANFSTLTIPMVLTPGDNDWTDCHRANNGAYDPLERLTAVRQIFYSTPGLTLGGGFKQVLTQADSPGFETFVENQIWYESSVAFGAVHVVGSNDSALPWYGDDTTGTKVDSPARRDAERAARNAATLVWLDKLFAIAGEQKAAGVVIMMQADTFSNGQPNPANAFTNIIQRIATLSKAFSKPVLLLQGDSHVFIADKPLATGNVEHNVTIAVPNLTRIVVQGSTTKPLTEWLRVHVDPSTPAVFTWERNAR